MSTKAYDSPISPSKPRQQTKIRLLLSGGSSPNPNTVVPQYKTRGHKRHRDIDNRDSDEEAREEKRPIIKLKFRNPSSSLSSKFSNSSNKDAKTTNLTNIPTYVTFPYSTESSTPSTSRMDIDTRPSTPTNESSSTRRPRSHSTSSSIVGLLVDETDTAPSSPIDTTPPSLAHLTPASPNSSTSNKSLHPPYIPSPLASTPILADSPTMPHPFNRAISDPSSQSSTRDTDSSMTLTPGPLDTNPRTQLMKTKHKLFMAEMEALSTEMTNVFKLGYGRGMGRGVGGGPRGPSRLRSGTQEQENYREDNMEVDE
ncbi:uncharacterized protein L201_001899 [Kwoniella dendrophila CBS 6074]|uniref:Uncharacterized protein n=1 Tax=Kwoniella dendrophila CBS 6074 TaxID=1295534 RepID=A0AAX4JNN0_9TREE